MPSKTALATVALAGVIITAPGFAAEISGQVSFEGEPPQRRPLQMAADPKCAELYGQQVLTQEVLVDENGGLANVFVYLKNPPQKDYPLPEEPVRLEQRGCLYLPRVQGIMVDQTLEVINDDPTLHNVRALADKNRPFNLGQPAETPPRTKTFKVSEKALKFKCDVHPWMAAYIFVMEHPFFATSDADGSYTISDVPPGTYTLVAWHEALGEKEVEVTVGENEEIVPFAFSSE